MLQCAAPALQPLAALLGISLGYILQGAVLALLRSPGRLCASQYYTLLCAVPARLTALLGMLLYYTLLPALLHSTGSRCAWRCYTLLCPVPALMRPANQLQRYAIRRNMLPCAGQALMLQLGSLLYFATRGYTLLRAVHVLLRRVALLGTRFCTTLQRAVPALRHPTRSHGILRRHTQQRAGPALQRPKGPLGTFLC